MSSYRYRAMTSAGAIITGVVDAPSEPIAIEAVRDLGHYPITVNDDGAIAPSRRSGKLSKILAWKSKTSARNLAIATQELAMLLKAGLELERALEVLTRLDETKAMRGDWGTTLKRVRGGDSFTDALIATSAFPKFFVNMARAGEQGGHLDTALEQLAEYLLRAENVRDAVRSALVYPAVLLLTAGLAIAVVLVFVLPQFEPLFADAGKSLPVSTQIVMIAGHFLINWGWLVLIAIIAGGLTFRRALKQKQLRRYWDGFLLRMPLTGNLIRKMHVERFGRTLGALTANAVPLPTALAITADTLDNTLMADATRGAAAGLREGDMLTRYLSDTRMFPPLALDMMRVGEETGQLPAMLLRLADIYERETRHTIDRLMSLLVPGLTIFMGGLVAGLIASVLMAVLTVNDLAM